MNIVITGGASGMGLSMARYFQRAGHSVHVTSRSAKTIEGLYVYELDFGRPETIEKFCLDLKTDKIDLLINNAGMGVLGPLTELTREQVKNQFESNVMGPIEIVSRLLPRLHNGHLVNVSSISPEVGLPFGGAYTASKSAMNTLSDIWRLELRHLGIKVTTLRPGLVKTHFASNADKSLHMREGSSFLKYKAAIEKRAALTSGATDPEDFASEVCPKLLSKDCPDIIYAGKGSFLWPMLNKVFPAGVKKTILLKKFGLL